MTRNGSLIGKMSVAAAAGALAVTFAAAMGPLAGPARDARAGRAVTPESCLACPRAADWEACHRTALALAMARDWKRAVAIEQIVQRMRPDDPEVAAVLARIYQEGTRDIARAFEFYHQALAVSPGYPPALLGLGSMMEDLGDMGVAARYFERGARERPDEPQFKIRLAEVLVKVGRDEQARPILSEIVERWPGSREADRARRLMPATALARP